MNHQEWLEWRRKGVGASDAPIIMGVSPWKTPYQLWEEKVNGSTQEDSSSMKRGRDLEEPARRCFEKMKGVEVFAKNLTHPKKEWMRASLDGLDVDSKVAVEIKCPSRSDHQTALDGMIPEKYYPQLQHQLEVLGLDGMYYFSFDGADGAIVEVCRDDKYIGNLLVVEEDFYKCMVNMQPPKLTERDVQDMESDEIWAYTAPKWVEVQNQLRHLEKEEELLRERLISLANGKSSQGRNLRLTRSVCKGPVDYSLVPELKNVDLDKYRKNSFTKWRLSSIS